MLSQDLLEKIKQEIIQEFPNDSMMQELHLIRAIHYEETKHLSAEERVNQRNKQAIQFLSEHGYTLIPTGPNTWKIKKESSSG